jgi:hypothetical protein
MGEPVREIFVAIEVAEKEFDDLCAMWDLDTDTDGFDEDEKKTYEAYRKKIVRLISEGRATIDHDKESITYTLKKPFGSLQKITFSLPMGESLAKLDKFKPGEGVKSHNSVIASMINQPASVVGQLNLMDYKIAKVISSLFLVL